MLNIQIPTIPQEQLDDLVAPFVHGVRFRAKDGRYVGTVIVDEAAARHRARGCVYGRFHAKGDATGILYAAPANRLELIDEAAFAAFVG